MPTGYTADVGDGKVTDFRTFALQCARNFGATIMQRDDPASELPKLREESDYYAKRVAEAEARIAQLAKMTPEEATLAAQADSEKRLAEHERYAENRRQTRVRYEAMMEKVRAWQPPTPGHESMKKFMLSQLTESIEFDCAGYAPYPHPIHTEAWLQQEREKAHHDLEYAIKSRGEEQVRCANANAWIRALYASLEVEVPA